MAVIECPFYKFIGGKRACDCKTNTTKKCKETDYKKCKYYLNSKYEKNG